MADYRWEIATGMVTIVKQDTDRTVLGQFPIEDLPGVLNAAPPHRDAREYLREVWRIRYLTTEIAGSVESVELLLRAGVVVKFDTPGDIPDYVTSVITADDNEILANQDGSWPRYMADCGPFYL